MYIESEKYGEMQFLQSLISPSLLSALRRSSSRFPLGQISTLTPWERGIFWDESLPAGAGWAWGADTVLLPLSGSLLLVVVVVAGWFITPCKSFPLPREAGRGLELRCWSGLLSGGLALLDPGMPTLLPKPTPECSRLADLTPSGGLGEGVSTSAFTLMTGSGSSLNEGGSVCAGRDSAQSLKSGGGATKSSSWMAFGGEEVAAGAGLAAGLLTGTAAGAGSAAGLLTGAAVGAGLDAGLLTGAAAGAGAGAGVAWWVAALLL